MTEHPHITRRAVLTASATGAGALALAACSPTSSGSASQNQATSSPAAGARVAALSSVPVGGSLAAQVGGADVIVSRPTAGTVACFSATCTHQGCTVQPNGNQLDCPCHGSVFNAFTGAVINGPAPTPLPRIAVMVQGSEIVTAAS
jgi:Rieske Fe-S protein